ncbi:MAG TPA: tetratricopeptide repeat protein, partial [Armatimonadetes bacterium]|nr:tetratricopeptide repeat protein [Armatimonadota bacterium]
MRVNEQIIDYYKVLGVPYDADEITIKKRYRELVRKYHPDIAVDKLTAHETFVQIVDAYQTLIDPIRRAGYDRKLREAKGINALAETAETTAPPVDVAPFSWLQERQRRTPLSILIEAEQRMLRGDLKRALELCRDVIEAEPKNPQAYGLLAEIFERLGQREKAVEYYGYAVQFAPHSHYYQQRMEQLLRKQEHRQRTTLRTQPTVAGARPSPFVRFAMLIAAVISIGICAYAFRVSPGEPLSELLALPTSFLPLGALAGLLCGFTLRWGRWLASVDQALFYGEAGFGQRSGAPMGVLIAIVGVLNFYFAVLIAILLSWWSDDWEPSLFAAFVICWCITAVFAFLSATP